MGRLFALGITAGITSTQLLPRLIASPVLLLSMVCLLGITALVCVISRLDILKMSLVFLTAFALGMSWASYRAQSRLDDSLASSFENVVTRLNIQIISLIQTDHSGMKFDARVIGQRPMGIPRHLHVSWPRNIHAQTLRPGQVWRAALLLKRPHGLMNPNSFDYEALMFQRGVRAIGRVRGKPERLDVPAGFDLLIAVEQVRQTIRDRMLQQLQDARYGAVMVALAIGDQNSVSSDDWRIFNLSGITHLVSISGSHVTLLAAVGASVVTWFAKRIRIRHHQLCEFIPARQLAAICAVMIAWVYCLLAGWGVPAQRTFYMLCVMAGFQLASITPSLSRVLCTAAAMVSVIDPWSTLSTGFWLSFGAVAVLFYLGSAESSSGATRLDTVSPLQRSVRFLLTSCKLQWLITVALCPLLIFLFQQFSASSLIANAVAIPTVSLVVTPLALASAIIVLIPGVEHLAKGLLWLAHLSFQAMMVPVNTVAEAPGLIFDFPATPWYLMVLAVMALVLGLSPRGTPARLLAWFCFLPMLIYKPVRPALGEWKVIVADVGQASAILIQTHAHNVLFDTGVKLGDTDSAERVLLPLFRTLAIRRIDHLVVSHPDNDHSGGLVKLLKSLPVLRVSTSFDLRAYLDKHDKKKRISFDRLNSDRCYQGQAWRIDGVNFEFLHPLRFDHLPAGKAPLKANAQSCVLFIQGAQHRALFTGDIGSGQETILMRHQAIEAELVVVAHHGSRSSSSESFVKRLSAQHAIAQVGWHNRFRHPDPEVIDRWQAAGATFWRTDLHGAIVASSRASGLSVNAVRRTDARYWHH